MAKNKDKPSIEEEDLLPEEEYEEDSTYDYASDGEAPDNDDTPVDPMGLAQQISKESITAQNFKELPREVKYSFYDNNEKQDVKHYSRAYRTHQYIEKIIDLRAQEDEKLHIARKKINTIKDFESLKGYFVGCNRGYLINDLLDLTKEEFLKILKHVSTLKHNYLLDTIEDNKNNIKELYADYNEINNTPGYIDDMGNIGKIVDTSVTSMGYKGNAAAHSVMTISAVKNEDIQATAKKERSFGFMDAIKNKLG